MSNQNASTGQMAVMDEQSEALRHATERAEAAEARLADLEANGLAHGSSGREFETTRQPETSRADVNTADLEGMEGPGAEQTSGDAGGVEELRKDSMMAHLLDSLEAGKDIGHYGRLIFAMVARFFLASEEVVGYLTRDNDFSEEQASLMLRQVEARDYNPPKRERILEWQSQQSFPILPNTADPDCGNLYRNLKFPTKIYDHIGHYQEEKIEAGE